jgi:hypothetical protein
VPPVDLFQRAAKLPDDSQDWYNDVVTAMKSKTSPPDPATFVDDKIIQRLRDYGVTHVARRLLENQGADWCRKMLAACDKQRKKDDDDPTVASRWCRKFAKKPDEFDLGREKHKPVSDDDVGEDEYEDDVQGVGQLPDVDVDDGEDEDREAKHYKTRDERDEELAMVGEL